MATDGTPRRDQRIARPSTPVCGDTMPTQIVPALDHLKKREIVVVRTDGARRYTGAGETAGAPLALAREDIRAGRRGEVEVFIVLVAEEAPAARPEPESDVTFDVQVGLLSVALVTNWLRPRDQ